MASVLEEKLKMNHSASGITGSQICTIGFFKNGFVFPG